VPSCSTSIVKTMFRWMLLGCSRNLCSSSSMGPHHKRVVHVPVPTGWLLRC
jgi:hypothetical protein